MCFYNIYHNLIPTPDSIWVELIIIIIGALIGGLLGFISAYFILKIQFTKTRNLEIKRKYEENEDKLQYFKLLLKGVVEHVEKRFVELDEYIENQQKYIYEPELFKFSVNNDLERIKSLDVIGLFESYRQFYKPKNINWIKDYKKLNASLDFIEMALKELLRIYEVNTIECVSILKDVKYLVEHTADRISIINTENAKILKENRFNDIAYSEINKYLSIYMKLIKENANLTHMNEEFLNPLNKLMVTKLSNEPFSTEISILTKKARTKLNDIKVDMEKTILELKKVPSITMESISLIKSYCE
ncbi:MAG: hypothetical protein ISR55_10560 [Bacteroidetes bacterium]|nr:hypothetical protein [Bacteroidota bacterium]MBL6964256.1 hypothetical protein [Bacteroidota bacterium]